MIRPYVGRTACSVQSLHDIPVAGRGGELGNVAGETSVRLRSRAGNVRRNRMGLLFPAARWHDPDSQVNMVVATER